MQMVCCPPARPPGPSRPPGCSSGSGAAGHQHAGVRTIRVGLHPRPARRDQRATAVLYFAWNGLVATFFTWRGSARTWPRCCPPSAWSGALGQVSGSWAWRPGPSRSSTRRTFNAASSGTFRLRVRRHAAAVQGPVDRREASCAPWRLAIACRVLVATQHHQFPGPGRWSSRSPGLGQPGRLLPGPPRPLRRVVLHRRRHVYGRFCLARAARLHGGLAAEWPFVSSGWITGPARRPLAARAHSAGRLVRRCRSQPPAWGRWSPSCAAGDDPQIAMSSDGVLQLRAGPWRGRRSAGPAR